MGPYDVFQKAKLQRSQRLRPAGVFGLRHAASGQTPQLKLNGLHNPFTGHPQVETLRNLLQMLSCWQHCWVETDARRSAPIDNVCVHPLTCDLYTNLLHVDQFEAISSAGIAINLCLSRYL